MSKRRHQAHVEPGIRKGIRTVSVGGTTQRVFPSTGTIGTVTYNGQITGHHEASYTKVPIGSDGLRRPSTYRVFAGAKVTGDYNFLARVGGSYFQHIGKTGGAYGVNNAIYAGTKLDGGKRVPNIPWGLEDQAIAEAKNKLQNQDLNVLVSLAELKETILGITSLFKRTDKLFDEFLKRLRAMKITPYEFSLFNQDWLTGKARKSWKTGSHADKERLWNNWAKQNPELASRVKGKKAVSTRIANARKTVDALSALWLAYSYAIQPLVFEIRALVEAVQKELGKPGDLITVLRSITVSGDLLPPSASWEVYKVTGTQHYGAECQLRYRVTAPRTALEGSLGLFNPLAVGWELTPYSFVFDWFIPVANFLASLTATVGLEFVDGFVNTKSFTEQEITTCQYVVIDGGKLPTTSIRNVCQFRRPLVATPFPGFYVSYKNPFSTSHLLTLAALHHGFIGH